MFFAIKIVGKTAKIYRHTVRHTGAGYVMRYIVTRFVTRACAACKTKTILCFLYTYIRIVLLTDLWCSAHFSALCNDFVPQVLERFWSVCRSFGSDVVCKTFAPCCAIMLVGYGMWDISVCHHCMPKSASSHAKKHAPIGSHSASSHAKKINLCSSILCFFSSLNQNSNDFYVSSTLQKSS